MFNPFFLSQLDYCKPAAWHDAQLTSPMNTPVQMGCLQSKTLMLVRESWLTTAVRSHSNRTDDFDSFFCCFKLNIRECNQNLICIWGNGKQQAQTLIKHLQKCDSVSFLSMSVSGKVLSVKKGCCSTLHGVLVGWWLSFWRECELACLLKKDQKSLENNPTLKI